MAQKKIDNKKIASNLAKRVAKAEETAVKTFDVKFDGLKLYIPDDPITKIEGILSEGFIFRDQDGTQNQIPEVTIIIKKNMDASNDPEQTIMQRRAGIRPIVKSFNSIINNPIKRETIYPNTFDEVVSNLVHNFNERIFTYFGYRLNLESLKETRFKHLFERARSGHILTKEAKI